MPDKCEVKADDIKGVLVATGDPGAISELKARASLFDVQPRKVDLHIWLSSAVDKVDLELQAEVLNNETWSSTDSDTGIEISATPRINDDDTITVAYTIQRGKTLKSSGVFRQTNGRLIKLSIQKPFNGEPAPEVSMTPVLVDNPPLVGFSSPHVKP